MILELCLDAPDPSPLQESTGPELCLLMATAITLNFTSLTSLSVFVNVKYSSQPLIVGSVISFIRNLSSVQSPNRDSLCAALLLLQQTFG
ncbi:hypothetical protein llap_6391 [Limosa lapponica baueri]|uniref:Uncharacterized protein n=1 Tax=Limosa lapponica baueri TaxID=1758121 RepID=A0A2I0UBC5_LIMLA|nr:hypothetical protein llap_6391 [Limosa lapponica baueri]